MKSIAKMLVVIAIFAVLHSCKRGDPLIGRWQNVEGNGWSEYFSDGTAIFNDGFFSVSGTWKRLEDERVKVDFTALGISSAEVYQVVIKEDAATFTDSNGSVEQFARSLVGTNPAAGKAAVSTGADAGISSTNEAISSPEPEIHATEEAVPREHPPAEPERSTTASRIHPGGGSYLEPITDPAIVGRRARKIRRTVMDSYPLIVVSLEGDRAWLNLKGSIVDLPLAVQEGVPDNTEAGNKFFRRFERDRVDLLISYEVLDSSIDPELGCKRTVYRLGIRFASDQVEESIEPEGYVEGC